MPSGKRDQNTGQSNGGAAAAARGQGTGTAATNQGGESGLRDQIQERWESTRTGLEHGYRQAEGMVARHPASSVFAGFGLGFGLGLLLTMIFTEREETWAERHIPDSWRHLPDRMKHLHMPDAIARHMPRH